ncbi:hypothetical protein [Pseudomonas graminis]|uniref:hypothetical protein n=1 Tax=Pseudomonas graminis TaxID=158627 RepID=UPI0015595161|nr:hypothetical protein [Pseudomonas graminis]
MACVVEIKILVNMPINPDIQFREDRIMFGFLADKAKAFGEAVGEKVGSAKDAVLEGVGGGASATIGYVEQHWTDIERVVVDGLLTVTHDRLQDDEVFLMAVEKVFELLPMPIRLVLPRTAFQKHSLQHRESIVRQIEAKRAQRLGICAPENPIPGGEDSFVKSPA